MTNQNFSGIIEKIKVMEKTIKDLIVGNQILSCKEGGDVDIYLVRMISGFYAVLAGKGSQLVYSRSFIPEENKRAALKKARSCFKQIKEMAVVRRLDNFED